MRFPKWFFILVLLAGCAKFDDSAVLARFDGQTITEAEFKHKLDNLPKDLRRSALGNKKEFLENMASEFYLLKEAQKKGVDKDPEVKDLLQAARRKILIAKLVETQVDRKVSLSPEEALKYYESHQEEFMTTLLLRASHILTKTTQEAVEIKNALNSGADFEETARAKSVDNTAQRGGDLGFFQTGQFVPEFEEVAFKMKKGEISDPVKSRFGYHIIKLTDRVPPSLRSFKSVKQRIEEMLINQKRAKAFKELVNSLKGNTKITIYEKALEAIS